MELEETTRTETALKVASDHALKTVTAAFAASHVRGGKGRFGSGQGNSCGSDDWKRNVVCHVCKQKGHIARECPLPKAQTKDARTKAVKLARAKYESLLEELGDTDDLDLNVTLLLTMET